MKRISQHNVCYSMSAKNEPVAKVSEGELFSLETEDCFSGSIRGPEDLFTDEMRRTANPATGPVWIEGVNPGQILCVSIEEITILDFAIMSLKEGVGPLGNCIEGTESTVFSITQGSFIKGDGFSAKAKPTIGVIGTAPLEGAISNRMPGEHGGNLDCKEITAGSRVYLPAYVAGALLSMGDLHAIMGDGEVCGCGAEAHGEVVVQAWAVHSTLPTPCVETRNHIHFISSASSLDVCEKTVLEKTHRYLTRNIGFAKNRAARIMGLAGDLRICQVANPLKTMKFSLPKKVLSSPKSKLSFP